MENDSNKQYPMHLSGTWDDCTQRVKDFYAKVEAMKKQREKDKFRTKDQIPKEDPPKMVGYF
mgnify:CR=1 FL=1